MLTFEETQEILDQLVTELPPGILKGLNCGVSLRENTLYGQTGLVILGQYHFEPYGLGRYVTINYGSMIACHGHLPPEKFIDKLRDVLHHELTHHLEHQAGDRSLEKQDEIDVQKMLAKRFRLKRE